MSEMSTTLLDSDMTYLLHDYVLPLWLTVTVKDTDIQAYSTGVRVNALSS